MPTVHTKPREPLISQGALSSFDLDDIKVKDDIGQLETAAKMVINRSIDRGWFERESQENKAKVLKILQLTLIYNDYSVKKRSEMLEHLHKEIHEKERLVEKQKKDVKFIKEKCYKVKEEAAIKRESVKEYRKYLEKLHKCPKCNKYVMSIQSHRLKHLNQQTAAQPPVHPSGNTKEIE